MASNIPSRAPLAGGFLIAIAVMVGAIWGIRQGQASLGVVVGFAIGAALAGAIWLVERMQR